MKNLLRKIILPLLIMLCTVPVFSQYTGTLPPPFSGCTGTAFLTEGYPTQLETLNIATGAMATVANFSISFNAMAYSRLDYRLYAIERYTDGTAKNNLIVIGSDYSTVTVPLVFNSSADNFDVSNVVVNSGSATSDGWMYVDNGTNMLKIDINPSSSTFATVYNTGFSSTTVGGLTFNDWAFGFNSNQYLYSAAKGTIYRGDVTAASITALTTTGVSLPNSDQFGAVFMDNQGNMYIKSNNSGKTYKITTVLDPAATHTVSVIADAAKTSVNVDAAACAAMAPPINGDFGDALATYNTIGATDGPRHVMPLTGLPTVSFGVPSHMTAEVDATTSATASADADNGATPASITTTSATTQTIASYSVTLSVYNTSGATAYISGWIDWNNNGAFDAGEKQTATAASPASGSNVTLTWTNVTLTGPSTDAGTFARFRISTNQTSVSLPTGEAPNGEVEDYFIKYTTVLPVSFGGSISAKITGGKLILNWTTLHEENNDRFEIDVSKDGTIFSKIGEVKTRNGSGSSAAPQEYDFERPIADVYSLLGISLLAIGFLSFGFNDKKRNLAGALVLAGMLLFSFGCNKKEKPLDTGNGGKLYVRIVQVDKDGAKAYSKVITAYKTD